MAQKCPDRPPHISSICGPFSAGLSAADAARCPTWSASAARAPPPGMCIALRALRALARAAAPAQSSSGDRRLQQPPRCRGHRGTWAAVLCVRRLPPQGRAADLPARHGRRAAWQQACGRLAPRWHRRRRVERAVACSRVCVTEVCCVFVSVCCALGYTFICGQNAQYKRAFHALTHGCMLAKCRAPRMSSGRPSRTSLTKPQCTRAD